MHSKPLHLSLQVELAGQTWVYFVAFAHLDGKNMILKYVSYEYRLVVHSFLIYVSC